MPRCGMLYFYSKYWKHRAISHGPKMDVDMFTLQLEKNWYTFRFSCQSL